MGHLVVDGKITSRFDREVAIAPGHGVIASQEVKGARVLSPLVGLVVSSGRPTLFAAAVRESVEARARGPELSTPAPG